MKPCLTSGDISRGLHKVKVCHVYLVVYFHWSRPLPSHPPDRPSSTMSVLDELVPESFLNAKYYTLWYIEVISTFRVNFSYWFF